MATYLFFAIALILCTLQAMGTDAQPRVEATITYATDGTIGEVPEPWSVSGGQAAYVNVADGRIEVIQIKCLWSIFLGYVLWTKNASGKSTILRRSTHLHQESDTFDMTRANFRPGEYWCTAWDETKNVSSDSIYLSRSPSITLRPEEGALVPFGGKATLTCDVEDDLSQFSIIRREYEYRYCEGYDCTDKELFTNITGGDVWGQSGSTLTITNVQELNEIVHVVCLVKWLEVKGSSKRYKTPAGRYNWSTPVEIELLKPPVNGSMIETPEPLYIAAISVGGTVLLALAMCSLLVFTVWLIKRINKWRTATHPDDRQGRPEVAV